MVIQTSQKRELLASALKTLCLGVFAVIFMFVSLPLINHVFQPQKASAATSSTINFQARLQSATGSIVADGTYNIEFKLYNVSTGGSALWTEDYLNSNTQGVTVKNGYVTTNLGSITPFSGINFDQDLYLTMTVRGTGSCAFAACTPADLEMSPRLKLTASAYAFSAGQLAQFNNSTGFTSTLSILQPTGGNQTFQIQDQGAAGTYNLLTSGNGVQLQSGTPGTAQTGNLNITGTGIFGTKIQAPALDTASAVALNVGGTASVINLNSNSTVAAGKTLTVTSGATSLTGATTGDALTVSNSTSTGNIAVFKDNATTVATIADGGAVALQNSVDSTLGLQVMNAAGGNLLSVGTSDKSITLGASSTPLINDNFTSNAPTGSVTGSATYVAGQYLQLNSGSLTNGSVEYTPAVSTNFDANYEFITPSLGDANWFYAFNTSTPGQEGSAAGGYQVAFCESCGAVKLYFNGTTLATYGAANIANNSWHTAEIVKTGTTIKVYYDSTLVINYTDITRTLSGTKFGLGARNGSNGGAHRVRNFTFSTSLAPSVGNVNLTVNGTQLLQPVANSTTAFQVKNSAGSSVLSVDTTNSRVGLGNASPAYALDVTGDINSTTGYRFNGTAGVTTTCSGGQVLNNPVVQGGIVTAGSCVAGGGSGVTTIGTIDTGTYSDNGASISGTTIYLQAATASHTGMVTQNTQTFGGDKTFNGSITLAATQTITMIGNTTASRPTGAEGKLYFDTSTKQLLVYANGKWQADRSNSTKIIAASNSSQAEKDAADYVTTGTSDQTIINTALAAAAGGKLYMMEGTYSVSGSINLVSNTSIEGAGKGTIIRYASGVSTTIGMLANTAALTDVNISDIHLDGNSAATSGTQYGVYFSFTAKDINISGTEFEGFRGSYVNITTTSSQVRIANNYFYNSGFYAGSIINVSSSSFVTIVGNTFDLASSIAIAFTSVTNSTISSNAIKANWSGQAIFLNTSNQNTLTGNSIFNGNAGIVLNASLYNTVSGNSIVQSQTSAVSLQSSANNNTISGNNLYDSGDTTSNEAIKTDASDSNSITGNSIKDVSATTTNYSIDISNSTSDTNYLADNSLGAGSINDAGTGTIYSGQQNASGYFGFKASTTRLGIGNVSPAYALDVTGDVSSSTTFRIGSTAGISANCTGGQILQATVVTGGIVTTGSCVAAGGGGGVSIVGTIDTGTYSDNGASISGSTIYLQAATGTHTGLVTQNAQTFGGNKTFNGGITLAATQTITMIGNTTANRPTGAEGKIYFDTDTKQLLVYANGKWQADRESNTKIVAANNSSQAAKDAADYVATGTSDQGQINSALTAAAGGKVYLLEGTYTVDGSISVPDFTTLTGAGYGTDIESSISSAGVAMIQNTNQTNGAGVAIKDIRVNGRKDLNGVTTIIGIKFVNMGDGVGTTARAGGTITNDWIQNVNGNPIKFDNSDNNVIAANTIQNNAASSINITNTSTHNTISANNIEVGGIALTSAPNNTISGNTIDGTGGGGSIGLFDSDGVTITGNTVMNSASYAISVGATTATKNVTITGNTLLNSTSYGLYLSSANNSTVSGNSISESGSTTDNYGIVLQVSDSNTITSNTITDTTHSSTNVSVYITSSGSDNNYLADNTLGGGSISDAAAGTSTGTVYANQLNASGNFILKSGTTTKVGIGTTTPGYVLDVTGDINTTTGIKMNGTAAGMTASNVVLQEATAPSATSGFGKIYVNSTDHKLHFVNASGTDTALGSGGGAHTIKLNPEFQGAVFYGLSANPHVGYMSSDYDSASPGRNFYSWATDQGTTEDYDIIVQYQLPSDFSSFASGSFSLYNQVTNTGANTLSYMMKDASGNNCYASGTYQTTTVGTSWTSRAMTDPGGSCTFAANDTVTFFFRLGSSSSAATDYTKLGSFQFGYN